MLSSSAQASEMVLRTRIKQWNRMTSTHPYSMISLIIPPGDSIHGKREIVAGRVRWLSEHADTAGSKAAADAATMLQQRLKAYSSVPSNGLVIFSGAVVTHDGKVEKNILEDIEPPKPLNSTFCWCDNHFHTEHIQALLECSQRIGFIVIDGHGTLFGSVRGSAREVLDKFSVHLPKKHGRGGQSALRFARLRLEKRRNYLRKVAELAVKVFIPNGERTNISRLFVAGCADFKHELTSSELFDPRLKAILAHPLLDITYGGEAGFHQAIEMSSEALISMKLVQEKRVITRFLHEVASDTAKYCFGIKQTIQALDMGALETLICWEDLDIDRVSVKPIHCTCEQVLFKRGGQILHGTPEELDGEADFEVIEHMPLVEWFMCKYESLGADLALVTEGSLQGHQFVKGFSGIGGVLRFPVQFEFFNNVDLCDDHVDTDDGDFSS